jgi:hypothetical protein
MPVPKQTPEANQPSDPKQLEIPKEDPQIVPDEFPPEENSPESPLVTPGRIDQ